ncbi:heme NO-binding domain-containing protein [Planctobacterium marinum]|uniref:Guanylate cyclase n=1 Tax=Planctobacterium marinum TaxID=1631968 RepID=A0AA48HM60_9ALTE|nr:guanylate cyclase [Planctobacterium marinum]
MKGVVFTEFMDMVEEVFSDDVLDEIIEKADLPNDGAYTTVGTYDHQEIVRLVVALSETSNMPLPDLLATFGKHLLGQFVKGYPQFFDEAKDAFDFLSNIDSYIHVEVLKLYPDAELPKFYHEQHSDKHLSMYYQSSRHFEDLAVGLIEGTLAHFNTEGTVSKSEAQWQGEDAIKFDIHLN